MSSDSQRADIVNALHSALHRERREREVERVQRKAIEDTLKGRKATTATKNRLEYTVMIREMQLNNAVCLNQTLLDALKMLANQDNYMEPDFDPCQIAMDAIAKAKGAQNE